MTPASEAAAPNVPQKNVTFWRCDHECDDDSAPDSCILFVDLPQTTKENMNSPCPFWIVWPGVRLPIRNGVLCLEVSARTIWLMAPWQHKKLYGMNTYLVSAPCVITDLCYPFSHNHGPVETGSFEETHIGDTPIFHEETMIMGRSG